jgi:homotetrameric cytidine deaminase
VEAATRAVCDFSGFAVGAALEDSAGRIFTGANVENASYNLGLCAERVALYHALTHGGRDFVRVAIATDTDDPTYPCGACRQALFEFAPNAAVVIVTRRGREVTTTVRELLPHAFDASSLGAASKPNP